MISLKLYLKNNKISLLAVYLLFITGIYLATKAYINTDVLVINNSIWYVTIIKLILITYLVYAASFTKINIFVNSFIAIYMGICFGSYSIHTYQNPDFIKIICLVLSAIFYLPGVLNLCIIDFNTYSLKNKKINYTLSFVLIFISKLFLIY